MQPKPPIEINVSILVCFRLAADQAEVMNPLPTKTIAAVEASNITHGSHGPSIPIGVASQWSASLGAQIATPIIARLRH